MESNTLTVFYDGSCPLCRREMALYRNRLGAGAITWCDVSKSASSQLRPGLCRDAAMARFHVQLPNGDLADGGDAFVALWCALPAFRVPGMVMRLPGVRFLVNEAYNGFLLIRPWLQRVLTKWK